MNAMPCGRRDALPLFFFLVALHVAAGADTRRHFGVHRDLLGTVGNPEIELSRAREDRLLMTGVAAQRVVLRARESLEWALHDVAAGAERVVVLHVVPADRAKPGGADDEHRGCRGHADPHAALSCPDPADDSETSATEQDEEPRGDRDADEKTGDLNPLRNVEEETQHRGHAAWQRRRADGRLLENQHLLLIGRPLPAPVISAAASPEPADPHADSADRRSNAARRSMMSGAPRAGMGCGRRCRTPCAWRMSDSTPYRSGNTGDLPSRQAPHSTGCLSRRA